MATVKKKVAAKKAARPAAKKTAKAPAKKPPARKAPAAKPSAGAGELKQLAAAVEAARAAAEAALKAAAAAQLAAKAAREAAKSAGGGGSTKPPSSRSAGDGWVGGTISSEGPLRIDYQGSAQTLEQFFGETRFVRVTVDLGQVGAPTAAQLQAIAAFLCAFEDLERMVAKCASNCPPHSS